MPGPPKGSGGRPPFSPERLLASPEYWKNPDRHSARMNAPIDKTTVPIGLPSPRVAADPRLIECWLLFLAEFPSLTESDRSLIDLACVYRAYINTVMNEGGYPDDKTSNTYLRIVNSLHSLITKREKAKPSETDNKAKKGSKYADFKN